MPARMRSQPQPQGAIFLECVQYQTDGLLSQLHFDFEKDVKDSAFITGSDFLMDGGVAAA